MFNSIDNIAEIPNREWFKNNRHRIPGHENDQIDEDESWINEAAEIIREHMPIDNQLLTNTPIFTLKELLRRNFPDTNWIVEQLIPAQGLVALSGAPGSYKSWITEHLAICVASGVPMFGYFKTNLGSVLIIDKENNLRLIKERFTALGGDSDVINFFNLESLDFLIENKDTLNLVVSIIKEKSIKLVIMDSLIRIHKQDENSASGMSQVFEAQRKIQDAGASILFTHHHRKPSFFSRSTSSDSLRGSSDILAAVDCHLAVDKLEDGIKITQTKLRQKQAIKAFKVRLESISGESNKLRFVYLGDVDEEKQKLEQARESIIALLQEKTNLKRQEIIDSLIEGNICSKRTAETAISSLTKEDKIAHSENRPYLYNLLDQITDDTPQNANTYIDYGIAEDEESNL